MMLSISFCHEIKGTFCLSNIAVEVEEQKTVQKRCIKIADKNQSFVVEREKTDAMTVLYSSIITIYSHLQIADAT